MNFVYFFSHSWAWQDWKDHNQHRGQWLKVWAGGMAVRALGQGDIHCAHTMWEQKSGSWVPLAVEDAVGITLPRAQSCSHLALANRNILSSTSGWMAVSWSQANSVWKGSTQAFSRSCNFKWDSKSEQGCLRADLLPDQNQSGIMQCLGTQAGFSASGIHVYQIWTSFLSSPTVQRDVRNQYNCTDCQDSLGIMCIFSFSLIQNPCFLWIITARDESEPANIAERNPTLFYKLSKQIWLHFADFFSLIFLHPLSFDSLWITWINLGKEWCIKGSLGRPSAGVQLASEKHCSVTSWRCITVNLKSSLGDCSPHVNATVPTSSVILRILAVQSEGRQ